MASPRQLAANRRNGAKGGPKTEAGKQQSRLGSLKHGLTASTLVVLPEEHEHEYQEVLHGFQQSFNPADPAEEALVLRLAQAHWRSLRSRRVETGILYVTAKTMRGRAREIVENCPENLNPHEAIGVGFMALPAEHWQMYMRYDATISRDFYKALEALQKLQRTRQNRGAGSQLAVAPLTMAAGASSAPFENGIRFVSQNSTVASNSNEDNQSATLATAETSPESPLHNETRRPSGEVKKQPILSEEKRDRKSSASTPLLLCTAPLPTGSLSTFMPLAPYS